MQLCKTRYIGMFELGWILQALVIWHSANLTDLITQCIVSQYFDQPWSKCSEIRYKSSFGAHRQYQAQKMNDDKFYKVATSDFQNVHFFILKDKN